MHTVDTIMPEMIKLRLSFAVSVGIV